MIDLNAMALFVRVVRSGGFSAAARALDLPKSSISRQVTALERRLGTELLRRSSRALSLTEAGESYYQRCLPVVEAAEAADAEMLRRAGAPAGLLRITATIGFGRAILAKVVCQYLEDYPQVRIDLHLTDERVNLVRDGFDLAVRMGALEDSEMTARRLGSFRRVVCASPAYVARRGAPTSPQDLQGHDCLILGRDLASWRFLSGADAEISMRVPWRMSADHIDVVLSAARAGRGIANLPLYVAADDLAAGTLVALLEDHPQPPVSITALFPTTTPSMPLRAMLDLLARRVAEVGRE